MFKGIIALAIFFSGFATWARTVPHNFLENHPHLIATSNSLQLGHDDWPDVEVQAIRHCLSDLKNHDSKNPSLDLSKRMDFFDDCSERWTTVEMKSEKIPQTK